MENGSLMKVESISECSSWIEINFGVLFEWLLKTGFTVLLLLYYYPEILGK